MKYLGSEKETFFNFSLISSMSFAFLMLIFIFISYALFSFSLRDSMPITKVFIEGDSKYLDIERLKKDIKISIDSGYLYLDIKKIRRAVMREPWVQEAKIKKVWPPALRVTIVERTPVARWGKDSLLDDDGEIFLPESVVSFAGLIELGSLSKSPREVKEAYDFLLPKLFDIGVVPVSFGVSERGVWKLKTLNGAEIIFGENLKAKASLFFAAYSAIEKDWIDVEKVDLRYKNGMAVKKYLKIKTKE